MAISSLEVKMSTQDDYFVGAGETLSGQPELTEKDLLFTKNWDIKFDGWTETDEETNMISLKDKSGETEYELTAIRAQGAGQISI